MDAAVAGGELGGDEGVAFRGVGLGDLVEHVLRGRHFPPSACFDHQNFTNFKNPKNCENPCIVGLFSYQK